MNFVLSSRSVTCRTPGGSVSDGQQF